MRAPFISIIQYKVFNTSLVGKQLRRLLLLLCLQATTVHKSHAAPSLQIQSHGAKDSSCPVLPAGLLSIPKSYSVSKVEAPLIIDGRMDEAAWQKAAWTDEFRDIAGISKLPGVHIDRPELILPTQVKMLWDKDYLYIGAKLKDPHLWATLKQRDTIIYHNNDFEVFFTTSPDVSSYYELEINQRGTLLDLFMPKAYRNGGAALIHWDLHGIKSAVQLYGTLNNPTDQDSCWTVEMAIPFKGVLAFGQQKPRVGDYWRMNFSRVQWDLEKSPEGYKRKRKDGRLLPEHNWVWSAQGIVNMHAPDRWGYLFFGDKDSQPPSLPHIEYQKAALWRIYYLQYEAYKNNKSFAPSLKALGISDAKQVFKDLPIPAGALHLEMAANKHWFRVALVDQVGKELLSLDQNGNLQTPKP